MMRNSLVSIVALGLFAGAPVMAQTTTDEATTKQMQQQTQQQTGTQQQATTQQQGTFSDQQFQEMLSGYEERSNLEGRIARAMTADGNDVFVLVGPRDLDPDESFETQDSDIRDRFEEAGFTGVQNLGNARIARANLDDDHYIVAFSADQIARPGMQTGGLTGETGTQIGQMDTDLESELGQTDTDTTVEMGQDDIAMDMDPETGTTAGTDLVDDDTQIGGLDTDTETELGQTGTGIGEDTQVGQMGTDTETEMGQTGTGIGEDTQLGQMGTDAETGQIGRALSGADADRMVSDIEGAGIQNADQFQGRVVRATSNGSPVFFLITSRDMSAEVDISEDEVRQKLQEADLQDIEFVDDVAFVRGDFEDDSVFVLAGDLMGRGMQQ
jgi:hypothetical protein